MNPSPVILEGGGLRLGFQRCGDRLAHTIGVTVGERLVPLLASVEGGADEPWPESPPLQTIDLQSRGAARLAMLVGMAGRGHWSLSVELDPAAGRLTFDVAARLKQRPERLGSAYRTMIAPNIEATGALTLTIDAVAVRIETKDRLEGQPAGAAARLRPTDDGLSLLVETADLELPCTVRWGYTVSRIA